MKGHLYRLVRDVIFDHCSVAWGSDTQLDWYGSYLDRATFQWNVIAECYMGQHVGGNRAPKNITGHGVNTWDYYELNHDGSTHLVDPTQYAAAKPFATTPVALDPVSSLLDMVLTTVGACKPSRDAIDLRTIKSVRDKTGSSHISTTGPWPDLAQAAPAPPADSDHDGMPDAWEVLHGLDPNNASDGASSAANGYTNVEDYLNELAGDPVPDLDLAKAVVKLQPATVNRYLVEYFQVFRNATGQGRISIARIVDYARQRQPATDELIESIKAGFSKNPALIDSH